MQTKTVTSDQARSSWGELIDAILAGDIVHIDRHNRPVASVISRKLYDRFQAEHLELLKLRSRLSELTGDYIEFKPEEEITLEAMEAKARAKGWPVPEMEAA